VKMVRNITRTEVVLRRFSGKQKKVKRMKRQPVREIREREVASLRRIVTSLGVSPNASIFKSLRKLSKLIR